MAKNIQIAALLVVGFGLFAWGQWPSRAEASPGPGFSDSFSVTCADTATPIRSSRGQLSYTCQNDSETAVAVGDADLNAPASKDSPIHCKTNCPSQEWAGDVREEWCRVDSGTVVIVCRALVPR